MKFKNGWVWPSAPDIQRLCCVKLLEESQEEIIVQVDCPSYVEPRRTMKLKVAQ